MNSDPPPAAPRRTTLLIVFLVVFIDLLGFGIVMPIMPRLADDYLRGVPNNLQGIIIGALFSSFSLMQFLFAPMWGRVSDRIGRRPVLLIGLAGSVVFYALFGYAASLPGSQAAMAIVLMFLARIGAGVAGATIGTAAAAIADSTPPEGRARGMALIGIAFGGGFALGPLIAYFGLEIFNEARWAVGAIASILSAIAFVLAVLLFRETRQPGVHAERGFFSLARTFSVLRNPLVGPLVLAYFLTIFAFANFEATLALFTKAAFRFSDRDNYLVFAFVGGVLLVAGGLYRQIAKRRPETLLLSFGVGLIFLGLGVLAAIAFAAHSLRATPDWVLLLKNLFYLAIAVAVAGFAFVNPSVTSLISRRTDAARQGEVLGVNQGCAALGRILGPLVGSIAFFADGTRILPYAVAVLTLLIVMLLLPRIAHQPPAAEGG